jgi:hypothetical protein
MLYTPPLTTISKSSEPITLRWLHCSCLLWSWHTVQSGLYVCKDAVHVPRAINLLGANARHMVCMVSCMAQNAASQQW